MPLDCEAARENIDAYALGALDVDDARALEAHLAGCSECRRILDEAREVVASLALTVPLASSGPALKARVLASASVLTDLRRNRSQRWLPAAAAALVVLSVGGLTWGSLAQKRANNLSGNQAALRVSATAQSQELASTRSQLVNLSFETQQLDIAARLRDEIEDIVLQPDLQRILMAGTSMAPSATGRYLWSASFDTGALVASKLPSLAAGKVYEMWLVYGDRWVPGGTFSVDASGRGRLVVRGAEGGAPDSGRPLWFCVTVEPAGGSLERTGEMVLRSPAP